MIVCPVSLIKKHINHCHTFFILLYARSFLLDGTSIPIVSMYVSNVLSPLQDLELPTFLFTGAANLLFSIASVDFGDACEEIGIAGIRLLANPDPVDFSIG